MQYKCFIWPLYCSSKIGLSWSCSNICATLKHQQVFGWQSTRHSKNCPYNVLFETRATKLSDSVNGELKDNVLEFPRQTQSAWECCRTMTDLPCKPGLCNYPHMCIIRTSWAILKQTTQKSWHLLCRHAHLHDNFIKTKDGIARSCSLQNAKLYCPSTKSNGPSGLTSWYSWSNRLLMLLNKSASCLCIQIPYEASSTDICEQKMSTEYHRHTALVRQSAAASGHA